MIYLLPRRDYFEVYADRKCMGVCLGTIVPCGGRFNAFSDGVRIAAGVTFDEAKRAHHEHYETRDK